MLFIFGTGAYLLGLMPPELIQKLGIEIPTIRRDPHWFIPTTGPPVTLPFSSISRHLPYTGQASASCSSVRTARR